MKYVLKYNAALEPSAKDVLELVLVTTEHSGEEVESVEFIKDIRIVPGFMYLQPKDDEGEEWKGGSQ